MPLNFLQKIKAIFIKPKDTGDKPQAPQKDASSAPRQNGRPGRRPRRDGPRPDRSGRFEHASEAAAPRQKGNGAGERRGRREASEATPQLRQKGNEAAHSAAPSAAPDQTRPPRHDRHDRGERPPRRDGFSRRRDRDAAGRRYAEEASEGASVNDEAISRVVDTTPWDPASYVVEPAEGKKRFHDFDLPSEIMHAIADLGFQYCTPIQAASLDQALAGANVAGRAQTGTGKTAAYLVAILTRYLRTPDKRQEKAATPRALVIAPTRELCVQICRDAQALGKYCGLRSLAVFGGMDYAKQQRQVTDGTVDLLAATPGRLLDFQRQRIVDLSHVDTLVIDEADRMLDMGFIPDVRRIISHLPKERQTLLYSATLNDEVMRLASQWMPDPVKVEIDPESTAADTIEQKVFTVTSDEKFTILVHLLERYAGQRVLVFANRRSSTEHLADRLRLHGFPCELLSGDVQQTHRMRVLDDFRSGATKLVVATDVAGRGLHIADIGLVVNFELPYEAEDYIHRIGRTGRAGKVGTAVSFADEDESFVIPDIEELLGEPLKCTMPDEELLAPLPKPARRERRGRRGTEAAPPQAGDGPAADSEAAPPPRQKGNEAAAETATAAAPGSAASPAAPAAKAPVEAREEAPSPPPAADPAPAGVRGQAPDPLAAEAQPAAPEVPAPEAQPATTPEAPAPDAQPAAQAERRTRPPRRPRGEGRPPRRERPPRDSQPSAPREPAQHPAVHVAPGTRPESWTPGQ